MNDYIVKLTRNVGIGSDIVNYFEKRGYNVVYNNPTVLPKTIMVRSENDIDELRSLMYVDNVVLAPIGRLLDL